MKTLNTQKRIIDTLNRIIENPLGSVFVGLDIAERIKNAAGAIGLTLLTGAVDPENNKVVLYMA